MVVYQRRRSAFRQGPGEEDTFGARNNILAPVECVADGGALHASTGARVPQSLPISGSKRKNVPGGITSEGQSGVCR